MGCRILIVALLLLGSRSGSASDIASTSPQSRRLFLFLAQAARDSYDDKRDDLIVTPSGCVALVRVDASRNLLIAFRGSMLGDRDPGRKPFSNLGGKIMRRNYRDWVATNLKQTTGFLPRQYIEAAGLVVEQMREHPQARNVFITGHSKGGGAAEYAAVNAWLSEDVEAAQKARMTVVTFNAAVVRKSNWRRLYRNHSEMAVEALLAGAAPPIAAVVMRDDRVSKIAERERPPFSRLFVIDPAGDLSPEAQHGIDAIIEELRLLVAATEGAKPER